MYSDFPKNGDALTLRSAALIFGLALVVRIGAILVVHAIDGQGAFLAPDSEAFLAKALSLPGIAALFGFDPSYSIDRGVMPIPAWLMSITAHLSPENPVLGYIVLQSVIDSLTCIAIAHLAGRLAPSWAVVAGVLAALNPTQIAISLLYLTDTVFLLFATLLLAIGLSYIRHPNWKRAALLGLILGLAGLSRVAIVPVVPVLLVLVFLLCKGVSFSRRLSEMVIVLCVLGAVMSPAILRNVIQQDSFTLTTQGGDHLLFWVVPLVRNFDTGIPIEETKNFVRQELDQRIDAALDGEKDLTGFESQVIAKQLGWELLWQNGFTPVVKAWVAGSVLNITVPASTDFPVLRNITHSSFYETSGDGFVEKVFSFVTAPENRVYALVMGFSFIGVFGFLVLLGVGLVAVFRRYPAEALFLCIWVSCFLALNGPIASPKYRLPIEPVWMLFAAAGLCSAFTWLAAGRKRTRYRGTLG